MDKKVFEKQQGVRVGNLIVLALPSEDALAQRKRHFLVQSYQVSETRHFVVCQKTSFDPTILMHTFRQDEINADLISLITAELQQFGILTSARQYDATLFAVLASPFQSPRDQTMIWRHFCLNTLSRLRLLLSFDKQTPTSTSHIDSFAAIYQRVYELHNGTNLLDVGSSFGFLPVLMAERLPAIQIVACDKNPDVLSISSDFIATVDAHRISFVLQDVLSPYFSNVGCFNTVTAVHLLEHLTEKELPEAFANLLKVTAQRLIVAVPYEDKEQAMYGHYQTFTQEKLQTWGAWCVDALKGNARYWCENIMGGMLVIDILK